jgi:hypothetical protein
MVCGGLAGALAGAAGGAVISSIVFSDATTPKVYEGFIPRIWISGNLTF